MHAFCLRRTCPDRNVFTAVRKHISLEIDG